VILRTDADTDYMHEGFDVNDPKNFSREWFAWANSFFSELVYREYWLKG
ncbi:metal-independent alpha-mannosidase, partial [Clostridium perfringens]|nr:metal-independent alpha-mannosidase [Clostridium perfringens]